VSKDVSDEGYKDKSEKSLLNYSNLQGTIPKTPTSSPRSRSPVLGAQPTLFISGIPFDWDDTKIEHAPRP